MIVHQLEEHETKRWKTYQKEIADLWRQFNEWSQRLQDKYLADLSKEDKDNMMHRISEDGRYIVSVDIEKLLGKK